MVSDCPIDPKTTSWLATKPMDRTECTGTPSTRAPRAPSQPGNSLSRPGTWGLASRAAEIISAVRLAVPEGASRFLA